MANVKLKNVVKKYDTKTIINDVSLEIKDKEFLVLVGSSGCGKSTILRMIAGLEDITGGEIYIGDRCVNNVHPKDRDIAFVFQSYALYPHMTVYENIAFPLKMRNFKKDEIEKKVKEAAEILNLTEYLDRKPKQLSGGQRQRVALGRAIVRSPKVFLMDEPLSNLDAKLRVQMRSEIKKLHEKLQTTFIYVTHDQTEALTMGDRIVVLDKGVIQQVDEPEKIYYEPANTFVGGFLGSPSMNFIDCKIENGTIKFNDSVIDLSEKQKALLGERASVIVGLRPEKMDSLTPNFDLTVSVDISEMLGSEKIVYFNINNAKCSAKIDAQKQFGSEIILKINSNDFLFFDTQTNQRI
ncbi:MAG: sn-glycerol-3-phosphate ABC transporter ATP-binding protein UgpC [Clostridium sp.]|nr:sn-glycerol-3-phosphate ABC transporter ATP-binding protein UgpC [Clostridium sp.]